MTNSLFNPATELLVDWPHHWDTRPDGNAFCGTEPRLRGLFCQRLKVILLAFKNAVAHDGLSVAESLLDRVLDSRSARSGAAIYAAALPDQQFTELLSTSGGIAFSGALGDFKFDSLLAPPAELLEGFVPFRYDDDGEFLHIPREAAEFAVGLALLDRAVSDIMDEVL